jgi:hypothetical protein
MDQAAQLAGVAFSYGDVAHSNTPTARDARRLLREARKKGVRPEVLEAIARSSGSGSPQARGG